MTEPSRIPGNVSSVRRVAWGSSLMLVSRLFGKAANFVVNVLLARLLTPTQFGVFFLTMSVVAICSVVAQFGMDTASVRFIAEAQARGDDGAVREIVRRSLAVATGATLAVAVVALAGGWSWASRALFGSRPMMALAGVSVALLVVLTLHNTLLSWLRGFQRIGAVAVFDGSLLTAGWLAMLASFRLAGGADTQEIVAARVGLTGLSLLALVAIVRRHSHPRAPATPRSPTLGLGRLAGIGASLMATSLVATLIGSTSDIVVLGMFRPSSEVAAYGVAVALASAVAVPYLAMTVALGPVISELATRHRTPELERVVRAVTGVVVLPTTVLAVAIAIAARPILLSLYGPSYGPAATILAVLSIAQLLFVVTGPCGMVLMMTGRHHVAFALAAVAAVASVASDVAVASRFGGLGVAIATSAVLVLDNVVTVFAVKRLLGIWTFGRIGRGDLTATIHFLRRWRGAASVHA